MYKVLTAAYCMHEEAQSRDFSKIRAVIEMNDYEIDSGKTDECYKNTNTYPQFDFGILIVSYLTRKSASIKRPAHWQKKIFYLL